MKALLCMTGWHGYSEHPVEIIGKTSRHYRIKSDVALKLPGRRLEPRQDSARAETCNQDLSS